MDLLSDNMTLENYTWIDIPCSINCEAQINK